MFRFTIRDVLWLTVIAALLVGWWKESAAADPRQTSSAEKKSTPLEGEWEVFSANYGTSGKAYYTFRGDQLTIEAWTSTEKRIDAPTTKSVEKWRVDIDSSKSPQRLVMNSVERQGKASVVLKYAFQLKDGKLWLTEDDGKKTGLMPRQR